MYNLCSRSCFHSFNSSSSRVKVAYNVAHVVFRTVTTTFIMGSRITGSAFFIPSLKAMEAATLNAISEESTSWYEPSYKVTLTSTTGISRQNTVVHGTLDTCVNRRDIFFRNNTSDDFVDKFISCSTFLRLDFYPAVTVLTFTTGLSDIFTF